MYLFRKKNVYENQNGPQFSELKEKANNLWVGLIGSVIAVAILGLVNIFNADKVPGIIFWPLALLVVFLGISSYLPAFIKYYFFVLPDVYAKNVAHTTAKLDYRNGYFLQAEDVRLSLPGDKNHNLVPGTVYEVFYLVRAKMMISARPQSTISDSLRAEQFTLLFGKVIGFSKQDLAANRNGRFPFTQRLKVLQKNWFIFLALTLLVFVFLYEVFSTDTVLALASFLGMFFLLGLIYVVTIDAKGVVAALFGRKIEQVQGFAYLLSRTSGRSERYYLEIPQAVSLEIHKRVYDLLVDYGLYYRVFYTRTKYLLSVEILSEPGQREQSSESLGEAMSLLNEKNFAENQNGCLTESQLSELKEKANPSLDLKMAVVVVVVVLGLSNVFYNQISWVAIGGIVLSMVLVPLLFRLPALIKYYFFVLPDARANNLAHTTAQLDYRNGYVLQAEDVRLSLPGDKNDHLILGNVYDVFYLPRAKLAISAKLQYTISASLQAEQFTLLFGKVIGFSEEDLAANRNGRFPFLQRLKVLQKNWLIFLVLTVMVFVFLYLIFSPDTFLPLPCCFVQMAFLLGLIYLVTIGAKGVVAALFGRKIEQVDGFGYFRSRGSGNSERYYFEIPQAVLLEIHKHVFDVLVDGFYYRVFYTPRTKYLLSLEILSVPGEREQ